MGAQKERGIPGGIGNGLVIYPIGKDAFETGDKDHSGAIDRSELEACMLDVAVKLGCSKPDKEAIDKEFQKWDTDKNGTIDFKEFQKFVKKNLLAIVNKV